MFWTRGRMQYTTGIILITWFWASKILSDISSLTLDKVWGLDVVRNSLDNFNCLKISLTHSFLRWHLSPTGLYAIYLQSKKLLQAESRYIETAHNIQTIETTREIGWTTATTRDHAIVHCSLVNLPCSETHCKYMETEIPERRLYSQKNQIRTLWTVCRNSRFYLIV